MPTSPDEWFESCPEEQQKLLNELRVLIKSCSKEFTEEIKWSQPCYSLNKLVCYLKKNKKNVALGFQQGAHLDDPSGLLEGTGKDMRHIKIHSEKDMKKAAFRALLKSAINYDAQK